MPEQIPARCSRCGKEKKPGDIFYIVKISLTCDFNGYLKPVEGELENEIKKELERAEQYTEEELMEQVYQEFHFYLCLKCRNWFVKHLLGKSLE